MKSFVAFLRRNILALPLIFVLSFSGCIYAVVGGIGALGGYAVGPDAVEGISKNDVSTIWDVSAEILGIMGTIKDQQESAGVIVSTIQGATVTVTITSINQTSSRLTVKARKAFLPKISVAQDVFVKIMSRLSE